MFIYAVFIYTLFTLHLFLHYLFLKYIFIYCEVINWFLFIYLSIYYLFSFCLIGFICLFILCLFITSFTFLLPQVTHHQRISVKFEKMLETFLFQTKPLARCTRNWFTFARTQFCTHAGLWRKTSRHSWRHQFTHHTYSLLVSHCHVFVFWLEFVKCRRLVTLFFSYISCFQFTLGHDHMVREPELLRCTWLIMDDRH